jgi:hypothetical protein
MPLLARDRADQRAAREKPWNHVRVTRIRSWQKQTDTFRPRPWMDIREFLGGMAADHDEFGYLVDIVDSVIEGGREEALCATTSMHDLCVASAPVQEPPLDVLVVRAPGSLYAPASGNVLIEHLSVTGRNDRIERPASEAVPLFWRFAIEKFGVIPPER